MSDSTAAVNAVNTVDFPVTNHDLEILAQAYFTDRLAFEYESWAEGADFASTTGEWSNYHYAGERLDAIRQYLNPEQMQQAKVFAERSFKINNEIGADLWFQFTNGDGIQNQ